MGMSEDFEVAVEEGATIVRLGRVTLRRARDYKVTHGTRPLVTPW